MRKDCVLGFLPPLIIIVACVFFWFALGELPLPRFEPMGPALFPKIVLGAIIGLTLLDMLCRGLGGNTAAAGEKAREGNDPASTRRTLICLSGFLFYLLLLDFTDISYLLLTFLFIAAECWYLGHCGRRALVLALIVGLGITALIYFIFGVVLQSFFP